MDKRFRVLSGVLLLTLTLVACGGDEEGSVTKSLPPSASQPAADLRVTVQREVEVEGGSIVSLSPNGEWLVVDKMGEVLSIYQAESLTEHSGALLEDVRLARNSITWSPDSTRVAFTDDAIRRMFESDLWVLEAETGELTNLTDDGVSGGFLGEREGRPLLDVSPAWSPDGKQLAFSRSVYGVGRDEPLVTDIYRVSASGGDPKKLLTAIDDQPLAVWLGLCWSSDGKQILYTVNRQKPDDPDNGVWIVDQDGKNREHILGVTDAVLGPPFLVDVAAQGDKALVWYYYAAGGYAIEPNVSYFVLLDLETGEVEPLKKAQGEEIEFSGPANATLSPGGTKVLYAYRSVDGEWRLAVRDLGDETENVLLTSEEPLGITREFGQGLDWAENDTLYVATSFSSGLLLSLGTE